MVNCLLLGQVLCLPQNHSQISEKPISSGSIHYTSHKDPNFSLDFPHQVWHHKFRCPFLRKTQINRCIIMRQPLTALPKKLAYNWKVFNSLLYLHTTSKAWYFAYTMKTDYQHSGQIGIGISIASRLGRGLMGFHKR